MSDQPETLGSLFDKREPLHPILRAHLVPDGPLGPMIKHPLISEIFYTEQLNAIINARFNAKSEALAQAIAAGNWGGAIALYERPYRINVLLKHSQSMTDKQYWQCVGSVWTDTENVWQCYDDWRTLWESPRPHKQYAMLTEERRLLSILPEKIKVYRGVHGRGLTKPRHRIAMSWTTDLTTATKFATAYNQQPQKVIEGFVRKHNIHAYFSRRRESEIVATKVKIIT